MSKRLERLVEYASSMLLIIVGLLGFATPIFSLYFPLNEPTKITLLIVASLALAIGVERVVRFNAIGKKIESLTNETKDIHSLVRGFLTKSKTEIRLIKGEEKLYKYVVRRMNEAKIEIRDLTWGTNLRGETVASNEAFESYENMTKEICKKDRINYKEIISFSKKGESRHIDRIESLLKVIGYNASYLLWEEGKQPLPALMIIDREEVIFVSWEIYDEKLSNVNHLTIKNSDIAKYFCNYYDELWKRSVSLKVNGNIKKEELKKIRDSLS